MKVQSSGSKAAGRERPVVVGSSSSQPRQEAAVRREGLCLPRSASGDNANFTLATPDVRCR